VSVLNLYRSLCDGPIPGPEESYRVCVSLSVIKCSNNPKMSR